jgi:hypothetical protein
MLFNNSSTQLISIISILLEVIFLFNFGIIIFLNHILADSLILLSICITFLIFPVKDISHKKIVSFGIILLLLEEIIEAAKLRSIQGSSIFIHLAMFA